MKENIRNYFVREDYEWLIHGTDEYVQVCIEAGSEIDNRIISEICKENDCYSIMSCIHNEVLGYCLMVEFVK